MLRFATSKLRDNFKPDFKGEYIVVPVTMLVEGVHVGLRNDLAFHPAGEIAKPETVLSFDGVPIMVNHPPDFQSAADPDIQASQRVGTVRDPFYDGVGLKASAWIDRTRAKELLGAEVLAQLESGKEGLEVSVGIYARDREVEGTFEGEDYTVIVSEIRADHLALLPGCSGACSFEDGCGVRAAQAGCSHVKGGPMPDNQCPLDSRGAALLQSRGIRVNPDGGSVSPLQLYHRDLWDQLQSQLAKLDSGTWFHFVQDINLTDSFVIYTRAPDREANPQAEPQLLRRPYSVDDTEVALGDEVAEVREERTYVPLAAPIDHKANSPEESDMAKTKDERVTALIANAGTKFDESDAEWLRSLSDDQLDRIEPLDDPTGDVNDDDDDDDKDAPPTPAPPEDKRHDAAPPTPPAPAKPVTVDEYLTNAKIPEPIRDLARRQLAADRTAKTDTIAKLREMGSPLTDEQLAEKSMDELEGMVTWAESLKPAVDYSFRNPGALSMTGTDSDEIVVGSIYDKGDK